MKMEPRWSQEEKQILKNNPGKTATELQELLPNRTEIAIKYKRRMLGINTSKIWSEGELSVLENSRNMKAADIHLLLPNRSVSAIILKLRNLYGNKLVKYSEKEIDYIKQQFALYVSVHDIAAALGRSVETVRQRIFQLHLKRDKRITQLKKKFRLDGIDVNQPFETIKAQVETRAISEKEAEIQKVKDILIIMKRNIDLGENRRNSIQTARLAGATLQEIADTLGMTRERVRQISLGEGNSQSSKPAHDRRGENFAERIKGTIQCRVCGVDVEASNIYAQKYCKEHSEQRKKERAGVGNFVFKQRQLASRLHRLNKEDLVEELLTEVKRLAGE